MEKLLTHNAEIEEVLQVVAYDIKYILEHVVRGYQNKLDHATEDNSIDVLELSQMVKVLLALTNAEREVNRILEA